MAIAYAHSMNAAGRRQPLDEHLTEVAASARDFAAYFGAGELAYYTGLLHDIGKYDPAWQRYLEDSENNRIARGHGPDHKGAGACLAQTLGLSLAALVIRGHHGGLPALGEMKGWLSERKADAAVGRAITIAQQLFPPLRTPAAHVLPTRIRTHHDSELFFRMLFSALVDADFLDTERHFASNQPPDRGGWPSIAELAAAFERDQLERTGQSDDPVNTLRHAVYVDCVAAAEYAPGFFRLTAPTGIGKTRSSLAFALRHAQQHDLQRIIYAIPYTSITEQTAGVFRTIFSGLPRAVLEHHSAVAPTEDAENPTREQAWARLAAENWDAPLIVTTTVQLFESLMAAGTSPCRKLHNIAGSVIILDEAQMLPTHLLDAILDTLRFLVAHCGVSVVLCTATQPALDDSPQFCGLPGIREIVREPERLFQALKRVEYEWPRTQEEGWGWDRVAGEMRAASQALAIVNTRADAVTLLRALDDPTALHLSTWMCGAHRRVTLEEIRRRLTTGEPCLLVSTQVIEAGVDVDFPLVLRAMGPLDRIVQAAGRCNREGKLSGLGRVIVFEPADGKLPRDAYEIGTAETRLALCETDFDFHDPSVYRRYFERWYRDLNTDKPKIQALRQSLDYPAVAGKFEMIAERTLPVVVRWRQDGHDARADELLDRLRGDRVHAREHLRALQPYLVSLSVWGVQQAQQRGLIAEVGEMPGLYEWLGHYDLTTGIAPDGPLDVERFIV